MKGCAVARACGQGRLGAGDLGHGASCHHFGLLALDEGETRRGLHYLTLACEKKDPASCYIVGSRLLRPAREGTSRDVPRAKQFLEAACDQGHGPACHNLAVMFKQGDEGVPADQAQFEKYAERTRELVRTAGASRGVRVA